MAQIIASKLLADRCNISAIRGDGSKASVVLDTGEIWLVDTTASDKGSLGIGKYDGYIVGDGETVAAELPVLRIDESVLFIKYKTSVTMLTGNPGDFWIQGNLLKMCIRKESESAAAEYEQVDPNDSTLYIYNGHAYKYMNDAFIEVIGETGASAYEVAVEQGYVGTKTEWLESLKGADGLDGVVLDPDSVTIFDDPSDLIGKTDEEKALMIPSGIFIEENGSATFATGENIGDISIFNNVADIDEKTHQQMASMLPNGAVVKMLKQYLDGEDAEGVFNGWTIGSLNVSHNFVAGGTGRICAVTTARVINYQVANGYSVGFNSYTGEYTSLDDIDGATWTADSGWKTGSGIFTPAETVKTILLVLSKNPTSSRLPITGDDGINLVEFTSSYIGDSIDSMQTDIANIKEYVKFDGCTQYSILHQSARYWNNGGIGTVISAASRDTIDHIFSHDELLQISCIKIPQGFDMNFQQTNTLSQISSADSYDSGWMQSDTDGFIYLSNLSAAFRYGAFNFRRSDNGSMTQDDTDKLNASTFFFLKKVTEESIIDVANGYGDRQIFDFYAYRKNAQYLRQPVIEVADLTGIAIQSICWIDHYNCIILGTGTTYRIYNTIDGTIRSMTKPSTGHNNDMTKLGNIIYVDGSTALEGETKSKLLYAWDIDTNIVTQLDVSAIQNGSVGMRVIGGVTAKDSANLLLVCHDYSGSTNIEGEKVTIYNYAIADGTITQLLQLDWHGWFIQGAAYSNNGLLYIATNKPSNGGYTGVSIWCINMSSGELLDELLIDGNFEPEGLQLRVENFQQYLDFGLSQGGYSKFLRTSVF